MDREGYFNCVVEAFIPWTAMAFMSICLTVDTH